MTHPTDALRLAPCPFCGGEAERFEMADRAGVRCADIMCAGSHRLPSHGEDYVAAWNRRAAPASPLPEGGGTSYAAGGLDVLSRIRSRLNEQIERAESDLNSTVTIRLNDAKAIRHLLVPAAPTGAK